MIDIAPKPRLFVAYLLQVPFGALCAVLLQRSLELEQPSQGRFPSALAQETVSGRDRGAGQAQIDAHDRIGWLHVRCGNTHHDMEPPGAITRNQIGGINRVARILRGIARYGKADRLLPADE